MKAPMEAGMLQPPSPTHACFYVPVPGNVVAPLLTSSHGRAANGQLVISDPGVATSSVGILHRRPRRDDPIRHG
jgi:hypothetical protein